MTKREDVIRTLINHASDDHDCTKCSYFKCNDCIGYLMMDAAQLLKAQEPRVLTLKEVQNNCPDYVYVEIKKSGWIECTVMDYGESNKDFGYFVYGIDEYFVLSWKDYWAKWRCWTAKPSGEQRKAMKWDES